MAETLDKETLKALSTDTRQEIIKMLSKRPYTASEISKLMNKHVTTITEHLDVLERARLIYRKDSTNKWVYYALTDKGQKIFKPAYYTWVITLSVALVMVVAFTLYQTMSVGSLKAAGFDAVQNGRASENGVFVDVGEPYAESGKNYVPISITDSDMNPLAVDVSGEIKENGVVPLEVADESTDISIKVHESITTGSRVVVPVEITEKKDIVKTGNQETLQSKTNITRERNINIKIIDSDGNTNSFPLKMRVSETD